MGGQGVKPGRKHTAYPCKPFAYLSEPVGTERDVGDAHGERGDHGYGDGRLLWRVESLSQHDAPSNSP